MVILRIVNKFRRILSRHQKIRIVELGLLMIISGFLEMMSVTLILPFIDAVMDPMSLMANRYISRIVEIVGIKDSGGFLAGLAFLMAGLFIIKNAFLVFQIRVQNRFVCYHMYNTQKKLLKNFLNRPYEYFLESKSGEILRVITNDTSDAYVILGQIISLFSELFVSAVLLVTVFVISPILTIIVGLIMLATTQLTQRGIRPVLRKAGLNAREMHADMNGWILQSIQGIKEIKLTCRIGQHDLDTKLAHAQKFLTAGNKVKMTVVFSGREMNHTDIGLKLLEQVAGLIQDFGNVDKKPSLEGRFMTMFVSPKTK